MTPLPLTRTAALADFPGCPSVAVWQQCHANQAVLRWLEELQLPCGQTLCYNWGAASFRAPGVDPIYRTYGAFDQVAPLAPFSIIVALSVLDRVEAPLRFLRQMAAWLQPGGLIVCTFAAWDATGEDCAVGHELRHRIYDRHSWRKLLHDVKLIGLCPFGGVDLRYHGDTLGDHTLATLVATSIDRRG